MKKIASPQDLQAELRAVQAFVHASVKPDRQVVAAKLRDVADRVAGGRIDRKLKRLLDKVESTIHSQVSRVTMNRGGDAHKDLDKLDSVVNRARGWLEDQSYFYDGSEPDMEALQEASELFDEMHEKIEEIQRELGDREYHEDDANEDEVMEYMEEQVYDLETMAESFGKIR